MIQIVVDDRERNGGLIEALERALGRPPQVVRLPAGDVWIGPSLRIERKTAPDFVASLLDGRLERQVLEQLRRGGRALLIVEGEFTPAVLGGMAPEAVRQALLAVQLDWQVPLVRARDVEETAAWIAELARREASGPAARMALPFRAGNTAPAQGPLAGHAPPKRPGPRRPPAVEQLATIPGVGPRRAEALLARFGTLAAIRTASVAELAAVEGIGRTTAEAIRKRLG